MSSIRLKRVLLFATLPLLIPLVAMHFTPEVNWNFADFLIMGVLLFSVGLLYEFVLRRVKSLTKRIVLYLIILMIFILLWAEMAVGIFGTPIAGN